MRRSDRAAGDASRSRAGVGQRSLVGHTLGPLDKPPGLGKGPGRHVVGTAGLVAEGDSQLEQPEKPALDFDRPQVGRRVNAADLRIVTVNCQLRFQRIDQIESPARQVDRTGRASRQSHLEI